MNIGSKDAGIDPDWDHANGVWKGKHNTANAVAAIAASASTPSDKNNNE